MEVTLEFEEKNAKTTMTLTHRGTEKVDDKMRQDMDKSWNESFDKLDEQL
jgi:hypothetical protein